MANNCTSTCLYTIFYQYLQVKPIQGPKKWFNFDFTLKATKRTDFVRHHLLNKENDTIGNIPEIMTTKGQESDLGVVSVNSEGAYNGLEKQ